MRDEEMFGYPSTEETMTTLAGAPVLVGVDGSAGGRVAVLLAARLAASRHRALRVVHAFMWPMMHVPLGPSPEGPPGGGLQADAERIVAEAMSLATEAQPGLDVTGELITGAPSAVLLRAAQDAAVVVLGSRGLGGFTGLLIGSVAVQVAAHAPCPVVVARGEIDRPRDVLVGVDGSAESSTAIAFAFEEASRRGVGLTALHAFLHPLAAEPGILLPVVYDYQQLKAEEAEVLPESLAGYSEKYPDVPVQRLLVRGRAAGALIEASDRASLVVVGSRGRGGFAGLLLGSVSQALLHHATCPVAVVRG
jgi:nucleotide-binding universal stress UspA family protein